MNKQELLKVYHIGTKIKFKSVNKNTGLALLRFALSHKKGEKININEVEYTLDFVSVNFKYNCFSIYFIGRGRLYRISDHWSAIQRGFSSKKSQIKGVSGIGKIATCWWTLEGDDQSFVAPKFTRNWVITDAYYGNQCGTTTFHSKVECGYVPLNKIKIN